MLREQNGPALAYGGTSSTRINRLKRGTSTKGAVAPKVSYARRLAARSLPDLRDRGSCGIAADDAEPEALIRRAERALHFGRVDRNEGGKGRGRLAMGLDRVRTSLEKLLKLHGLLVPDAGSGTYVDQTVQLLAGPSEAESAGPSWGAPVQCSRTPV